MTGSLRLAEAVLEFLLERELALLVALQGGSILKGGFAAAAAVDVYSKLLVYLSKHIQS